MAQRTQILYVDDIDGSEADGTVRFGLGGADYEIDLNKKHADQLATTIRPYIDAGRKVSSSRRAARGSRPARHNQSDIRGSRPARHNQSDIRAWARSQGLKISDRGRIPADVLAKYESAH